MYKKLSTKSGVSHGKWLQWFSQMKEKTVSKTRTILSRFYSDFIQILSRFYHGDIERRFFLLDLGTEFSFQKRTVIGTKKWARSMKWAGLGQKRLVFFHAISIKMTTSLSHWVENISLAAFYDIWQLILKTLTIIVYSISATHSDSNGPIVSNKSDLLTFVFISF